MGKILDEMKEKMAQPMNLRVTNAEDYMFLGAKETIDKAFAEQAQSSEDLPTEAVNHPQHYNGHPSGIECIEIVRHFNFNVGNAIKVSLAM